MDKQSTVCSNNLYYSLITRKGLTCPQQPGMSLSHYGTKAASHRRLCIIWFQVCDIQELTKLNL